MVEIPAEVEYSFDDLPADQYLEGPYTYRYRRHSTGLLLNGKIAWDPKARPFFQSENINTYAGGLHRTYEEVEPKVLSFLAKIIPDIFNKNNGKIGVHQIRVTATDDYPGFPAPEGFHQDGFDLVGMLLVYTHYVTGGISTIALDKKGKNIISSQPLKIGQPVVIDDRKVYHYVSPIAPAYPAIECHRDIFIFTFLGEQTIPRALISFR